MLDAILRVPSDNPEGMINSISPETDRELARTSVSIHAENGCAVLKVTATDTSAMRAALNSYLECIKVTEDIEKIVR